MEQSQPSDNAALAAPTASDAVADGTNDVAMTKDFEKMMTEATGRQLFQRVWLWTTSEDNATDVNDTLNIKKATTATYDPVKDGPVVAGPCPPLPQNEELFDDNKAKEYLEVGIVIGDNPKKYMPQGESRNKARDTAGQQRGVQRRDPYAVRAFIPISPYIQEQAEFYEAVDETKPSQDRLIDLTAACKRHAALSKTTAGRPIATVAANEVEKKLMAHPLVVTKAEHLASTLVLQFSLFEKTQEQKYLKAMIETMEKVSPDLKYGPHTSTKGINAFMDFETELTNDLSFLLTQELKAAHPLIQALDAATITAVHAALRRLGKDDVQALRPDRLGVFLELCHLNVGSGSPAALIDKEVGRALQATRVHHRHVANPGIWTAPIPGGHSPEEMSQASFLAILSAIRDFVHQIDQRAQRGMDAVVEQHGAILKHASLDDLMTKMSSTVDVATLGNLMEQLGALHAGLFAAQGQKTAELLRELIQFLDKVIVTHQTME